MYHIDGPGATKSQEQLRQNEGEQPPPLETKSGQKKKKKKSNLIHKNEDEMGGDLDLAQQLRVSATFLPRIACPLLSFRLFIFNFFGVFGCGCDILRGLGCWVWPR